MLVKSLLDKFYSVEEHNWQSQNFHHIYISISATNCRYIIRSRSKDFQRQATLLTTYTRGRNLPENGVGDWGHVLAATYPQPTAINYVSLNIHLNGLYFVFKPSDGCCLVIMVTSKLAEPSKSILLDFMETQSHDNSDKDLKLLATFWKRLL